MIPTSVKIIGQVFTIEEHYRSQDGMLNDGSYGYTLDQGNLIVIDKDLSLSKKQNTLLHEILHCIRFNSDGMPKPKKKDSFEDYEHYFIGLYESSLLAVLRENPQLVEWLTK
jgi:Zn-dependent peptidase ImmA (M78 family)